MADVAKIGLQVEARGVKQTFDELDKLAKSSSEVSKQMDKLVPLMENFSKVDLRDQSTKLKAIALEMSSFTLECNKMVGALAGLRISTAGLADLKIALSGLSKISSNGLSKHAENIQKLSTALSASSTFGSASSQFALLQTALSGLATTPQTLSQIALAAGEFKGKATSINNFVKAIEKLAVIAPQLPVIATQVSQLAAALGNMSGVSAPVAALVSQLKLLQQTMGTTINQANAATSQAVNMSSRGSGGGGNSGFGVGTLVAASGVDASIAGAFSAAKSAIALADTMANLSARVKLVTSDSKELKDVQAQLFNEANKSRTSVTALTESYVALSRSTKSLGLDQKDIVDLSSKMSMAFKVGGGSATSFNSAMIQMNQGFSSGVLRGQEFNSMSEQAPILLTALRKGLEATTGAVGLTEGALRKMANAGELTTDVVIPALQVGLKEIEKEFNNLPLTAEGGWTILTNSVAKTLDELNKSTGVTNNIAESFVSLGKTLENSKGTLEGVASAIPLAALGALTLAITQTGVATARSVGGMVTANIANKIAVEESRLAEVTRLATLNAGIPIHQRTAASITASMEATRLYTLAQREAAFATTASGRSLSAVGGIFSALGGWVTVAAVAITGIIYYWDELAAALGNVSAKAKQAEDSLKRAMRLKDVGLIGARQAELDVSISAKESQVAAKENDIKGLEFFANKEGKGARAGLIASKKKELEELRIEAMELKALRAQASEVVKGIKEEKGKAPVVPRTAVDTLADQLQSSVSTKENKGKLALAMLAEQTKLANDMSKSLEVRDAANARVKQLQEKSYEFRGKMYNLIDYEAVTADVGKKPKVANPNKGLNSSQSRDATADAEYKTALTELTLAQNNSAESLDKLTTAGKKALQIEAQLSEAKSKGSKVGKETISSMEYSLEVTKKTAAIEEKLSSIRKSNVAANLQIAKTEEVLATSLSNTNEFLEARDELIRTGSIAEVIDADQKKLLAMRKAFASQLAKLDVEIAHSLSSKETETLIARRSGLKANLDRVQGQVVPSGKFNFKTEEGVKEWESKALSESSSTFGRDEKKLSTEMGEASSSDVQLQLGDQYNTLLETQKQREVDIHASAEEKLKAIEDQKITRYLEGIKYAESFATTMMDITSSQGQERLAKEKENFKNQSALYKAFFVMQKAAAIAQVIVSGTQTAAAAGAQGSIMGGIFGAAGAQAIAYGMMAAQVGMIAGTTIGMFAKGSAFDGSGVVSSPTAFSHGGGKGVMGEAGPEGILPLATGPDGKLGVQMYGGDKSNGAGISKITIVNQTTGRIDSVEERQISPTEKQIIIKEAIEAVNGNIANPNSSTSKAFSNNYTGMRRNR